jgi:hypothetical protein
MIVPCVAHFIVQNAAHQYLNAEVLLNRITGRTKVSLFILPLAEKKSQPNWVATKDDSSTKAGLIIFFNKYLSPSMAI